MTLPEEFLDRLKQSNDIVSAMGAYSQLKKAGRDFVCLCPFHSEKTPSCHIYTDSQSFYCFGCGSGGDIITFTRLTENLDYIGAVRLLADRSGLAMPDGGGNEELFKRSKILEMNREAARFFRDALLSENGRAGLEYLLNRGLTANTVRKYGLGYAANRWDSLKSHMNYKGYDDAGLVEASLLTQGQRGLYDKFRNRVMFPIIDRMGNVVGFSGRRLSEREEDGPKYLNSSETPVFRKRENLFSLNFAKNSKKSYMLLCEGNIDVITLNQAGFDNAVATLGTAVTPEQARLLRNYCGEVVLAYDSDAAGQKATVKAINLFGREGINARVLRMNGAKDPDDYVRRFGGASFAALAEESGSAIGFELDRLKKSAGADTPEGRADYLKKAVNLLAGVDNRLDRMVYISELARDCEVTSAGVEDAVERAVKSKNRAKRNEERRELLRPAVKRDTVNPDADKFPGEEKAERGIIAFLLHSPDKLPVILRNLTPEDFPTAFNRRLFETLILRLNKRRSADASSLGSEFSAEETGRIESIRVENSVLPFTDERLSDYIKVLTDFKRLKNKKSADEMSNEEALEYAEKLKREKFAGI
ncbi:MAG: DNA primase [Oscillospiraceae bacterium]|jgi:DNA primase|nr:DNA primase [Oscillospiraceae bacterium]